MQRKSGLTVSGAQRRAASARVSSALHFAAQPEVWERFSHRASSANAEASALASSQPRSSGASGIKLSGLEARDRGFLVLVKLEDRVELRHLEQLPDLGARVQELRLSPFLLGARQGADESTQAGAIQKTDAFQIDQEVHLSFLEQSDDGPLESGLGLSDHEIAVESQDGDPTVLRCPEVHSRGELCPKRTKVQNRKPRAARAGTWTEPKLEPTVGLEPTTCGLRNRCSTN